MIDRLPLRYELKSAIGRGGFGETFLAVDNYLGREVVVKSLLGDGSDGDLTSEMRMIATARSRHVVDIYDLILDNSGRATALIIEHLSGRTYDRFWESCTVQEYLRSLYQIACGLRDLHALGIIHRDLKPENFRDSSSGVLKLFDFGISVDRDDHHTIENRGTFWYLAPEMFRRRPLVTPAVDVYALGVCAWSLRTDALPAAIRESPPQSSAEAPSITTIDPSIPEATANLVGRCLRLNPMDRPSAAECVSVLRACLVAGSRRAMFVGADRQPIAELSRSKPGAGVTVSGLGTLRVGLGDKDSVVVERVDGEIFINNMAAHPGDVVPASCVITFGGPERGQSRHYVTFVSSHPEVVI